MNGILAAVETCSGLILWDRCELAVNSRLDFANIVFGFDEELLGVAIKLDAAIPLLLAVAQRCSSGFIVIFDGQWFSRHCSCVVSGFQKLIHRGRWFF